MTTGRINQVTILFYARGGTHMHTGWRRKGARKREIDDINISSELALHTHHPPLPQVYMYICRRTLRVSRPQMWPNFKWIFFIALWIECMDAARTSSVRKYIKYIYKSAPPS